MISKKLFKVYSFNSIVPFKAFGSSHHPPTPTDNHHHENHSHESEVTITQGKMENPFPKIFRKADHPDFACSAYNFFGKL